MTSRCALGASLLLTAVALLASVVPSSALGSDSFYFENRTGMIFTPNDQDVFEECWYGATGVFVPGPTGAEDGSIRSEEGFGCEMEAWGANLAYDQRFFGHWEQSGRQIYFWESGIGAFGFDALDPLIGFSSLSCQANGPAWEEGNGFAPIEQFMSVEVDGHACTAEWLPGVSASAPGATISAAATASAGHVRLVDSLARVRGGKAQVRVQVFGRGHARHEVEVVLRSNSGEPLGRASRKLEVGDRSRLITVPIEATALGSRPNGKDVRVRASASIDSLGGSGDTTAQLVLRRRSK